MGVTIVLGGQYGSEGKGKIVGYLADEFEFAIRTGGPNAGHTVNKDGKKYILHTLPSTLDNPDCKLAIGAGAVMNVENFFNEIENYNLKKENILVDPKVGIIEERHKDEEKKLKFQETFGSTQQGVGSAIRERILRGANNSKFKQAKDIPELKEFIGSVSNEANKIIDRGGKVLLEGTQGFGLSLFFGCYPYVTGRETNASTLLGEAGLSPKTVDDIILVIRSYPIRVGGGSGPLKDEIDWETVTKESGYPHPVIEKTTTTNKIRRVGRFDMKMVKDAITINKPTHLSLNFADYITYEDYKKNQFEELSQKTNEFITNLEKEGQTRVSLIGTGPDNADIIDRM